MDRPIALSDRMLESLGATRPWVKFLSIVAFVYAALSLIMGLAMSFGLYTGPTRPGEPAFLNSTFGIFYIVSALVFDAIPGMLLYRYAKAIAGYQESEDSSSFEDALKQQKSVWKYAGILAMIFVVLFMLGVVIGIFGGFYRAAHHL
ncbi:MAG: hypothetical protein KGK44_10865 [Gammaproteobacteria bacterium]|nr:hypothetical protein [Gammaproteobacteria bacterium]